MRWLIPSVFQKSKRLSFHVLRHKEGTDHNKKNPTRRCLISNGYLCR